MRLSTSALLLLLPLRLLGQGAGGKTMAYYDAQNRWLPAPTGAAYAVETRFTDSLRAVERVYWAPQKIREQASFSNIQRRLREGETLFYYDNGQLKRREQYKDGFREGEGWAYFPNGTLRRRDKWEQVFQECFDAAGSLINCDTLARRPACPELSLPAFRGASVQYSAQALKLNQSGVVKVELVVSRAGQLVDAWILESPSPLLSAEALKAVRKTQWRPRLVDCDPVDTALILPITFRIE